MKRAVAWITNLAVGCIPWILLLPINMPDAFSSDIQTSVPVQPKQTRKIHIRTTKTTGALGGSLVLYVRYINDGNQAFTLRQPERLWETQLKIGRRTKGQVTPVTQVPFGRITHVTNAQDMERRIVEPAENITLAPGQVYEFSVDIGARWPELFAPGVTVLQVVDLGDDVRGLTSNAVEVKMTFEASSFANMLAIVGSPSSSVDSRRFAQTWIDALHPGSGVRSTDTAPADPAQIQKALAWWNTHANDAAVKERIRTLKLDWLANKWFGKPLN